LLLRESSKYTKVTGSDDFTLPEKDTIERMNELATAKLAEIVRRYTAGEQQWSGYDEAEIKAARDLLSKDESKVQR
jgi:hypothetical protein